MKSKHINFIVMIVLFVSSCEFLDLSGLFFSSDVDNRFKEKNSLKNYSPPIIPDTNNYSFLVITDTHYYDIQLGYIENIENNNASWNLSFIIVNGDIVQSGKKYSFELVKDDISKTTLPVYPVIGNHDLYNNGFENYKKYFGRTVYDFKIGITHLIFLDTANGTLGEEQKPWLEKTLKNSGCKYKIIFTHYSPTAYEMEEPTAMSYPEEAYYIFDLCERYHVNYYICGHLHFYDYKEIRGTKYIIINAMAADKNSFIKISIESGNLKYNIF